MIVDYTEISLIVFFCVFLPYFSNVQCVSGSVSQILEYHVLANTRITELGSEGNLLSHCLRRFGSRRVKWILFDYFACLYHFPSVVFFISGCFQGTVDRHHVADLVFINR